MEDYLGPVKTKRDDLFLKLVKRVRKPDYTMHFMEDRNGRKAMFYNYKGVEIKTDECCILKATIAEHRRSKFDNGKPLTYLNRVTVVRNLGSKENPKIVFGEEATERGSNRKSWQETLAENEEIEYWNSLCPKIRK